MKLSAANSFFVLFFASALFLSPVLSAQTMRPVSGTLRTKDGISISYDHYRQGFKSVIVVCPGFFNSKENRWMRKTAEVFLPAYDVIMFDFRGHGSSSGKYTWSAKENLDLDAVLDYAKTQGYARIGIVAYSLGAAAAINDAAARDDIDSMVLVSCPYRFDRINYYFWEPGMFYDLKENMACKWEGKGARTAGIFTKKEAPIDSIKNIKRTALFLIQGDSDWVIKDIHAKKLYEAARTKKKMEIIKRFQFVKNP